MCFAWLFVGLLGMGREVAGLAWFVLFCPFLVGGIDDLMGMPLIMRMDDLA